METINKGWFELTHAVSFLHFKEKVNMFCNWWKILGGSILAFLCCFKIVDFLWLQLMHDDFSHISFSFSIICKILQLKHKVLPFYALNHVL